MIAETIKAIPIFEIIQTTNNVMTISIKSFRKRNRINGAEIINVNNFKRPLKIEGFDFV